MTARGDSAGEGLYGGYADALSTVAEMAAGALRDPIELPPLVLAYVGDSAYELFVRTRLAHGMAGTVHRLHSEATRYSRCASQAAVARHIYSGLDDTERGVMRRARNAKPGFVPKNAGVVDYRNATGLEALIGYLYLKGNIARLCDILESAAKCVAGALSDEGGQGDEGGLVGQGSEC